MGHFLALFSTLLLALCALISAAPAPAPAPAPANEPQVQFLKYRNDQEFEALQRQIIAQYDHLGGSSQFHNVQSTHIDPSSFQIHL